MHMNFLWPTLNVSTYLSISCLKLALTGQRSSLPTLEKFPFKVSVSPLAPDVNVNLPSQVLYKILLVQTLLSHGELSARAAHSAADTSSLSSNLIRFHRVSNRAVNRNWRKIPFI